MNIGNKIKELRKQRGITQEQLANIIGVSFQAVSKWENNISLPDISILPVLASYFGVSIDELFNFNIKEIEEKALAIAKESWKYRNSDWEKARNILEEGLKKYPDNDILLINLLYVTDNDKFPDETIEIASKIIDITKDEAIKYDACRFMAFAYKAKNDLYSAKKTIDIIPEIYISNLSEKAKILDGEEKFEAACKEASCSLRNLIDMYTIIADCYAEKGKLQDAMVTYEKTIKALDILESGKNWDWARKRNSEKMAKIQAKIN